MFGFHPLKQIPAGLLALAMTVLSGCAGGDAPPAPDRPTPDRPVLTEAMIRTAQGADIVMLGEVHDNALHHLGQADALKQLRPKAVVFEMLTEAQAAAYDPALKDDPEALSAALGWADSGWPDFALYAPVFAELGEARVYAAARPRAEVREAFNSSAAAVFGPGAAAYGLTDPVPAAQLETRKQLQFDAHCQAMPMRMMGGMVEAQRLRDAALADAAVRAVRDTGGPVAVILGAGHARDDWGAPAMVRLAAPDLTVATFAFTEGDAEARPFGGVIPTEAAEREDPCAALRNG